MMPIPNENDSLVALTRDIAARRARRRLRLFDIRTTAQARRERAVTFRDSSTEAQRGPAVAANAKPKMTAMK